LKAYKKALNEEKANGENLKNKLKETFTKEKEDFAKIQSQQQDILALKQKLESEAIAREQNDAKQKAAITKLYNEHQNLKQAVTLAVREANELKVRYLEAVKEKISALGQSQRVSKEIEKYSQDATEAKKKLNDVAENYANQHQKALEEFKEQRGLLLTTIDQTQNALQNALSEKESQQKQLENFEENIHSLTEANQQLKTLNEKITEELKESVKTNADNEEQLIAAKQHVAKKVKEVTMLHEKIDLLHEELALQDEEHKDLFDKYKKLQQSHEEELLKENEHEEKLNLLIKEKVSLEEKLAKKLKECLAFEMQLKDFKDMEMRHSELQKLLGGLGKVLSPSLPSPSSIPAIEDSPTKTAQFSQSKIEEENTSEEKAKVTSAMEENESGNDYDSKKFETLSLFDIPKSEGQKSKNSLF